MNSKSALPEKLRESLTSVLPVAMFVVLVAMFVSFVATRVANPLVSAAVASIAFFTFVKSSDKAFVKYSRDDPYFSNVLHYFKFESPTGLLHDYRKGYPEPNVYYQFITKKDFSGYGILDPIPDIPDCNEGGQMYFSIKKEMDVIICLISMYLRKM